MKVKETQPKMEFQLTGLGELWTCILCSYYYYLCFINADNFWYKCALGIYAFQLHFEKERNPVNVFTIRKAKKRLKSSPPVNILHSQNIIVVPIVWYSSLSESFMSYKLWLKAFTWKVNLFRKFFLLYQIIGWNNLSLIRQLFLLWSNVVK